MVWVVCSTLFVKLQTRLPSQAMRLVMEHVFGEDYALCWARRLQTRGDVLL